MGWVFKSFDHAKAESGEPVTEESTSVPSLTLLGHRMMPKEHVAATTGAVAIDIDETTGALIVFGAEEHVGQECFVRGPEGFHKHVWFLDRVMAHDHRVAAVFASLDPGTYRVDIEGVEQLGLVRILPGAVQTLTVKSTSDRA